MIRCTSSRALIRSTVIRRLAAPESTPAATNRRARSDKASEEASTSSATSSKSPNSRRPLPKAPPLSLEHFLLRSRVLNLYRTIVRAIYQIPDPDARKEPIAHAKEEFARNKNVKDTAQIRYLVSTGKAEWDGMRRYVEELAMRGRAR